MNALIAFERPGEDQNAKRWKVRRPSPQQTAAMTAAKREEEQTKADPHGATAGPEVAKAAALPLATLNTLNVPVQNRDEGLVRICVALILMLM